MKANCHRLSVLALTDAFTLQTTMINNYEGQLIIIHDITSPTSLFARIKKKPYHSCRGKNKTILFLGTNFDTARFL